MIRNWLGVVLSVAALTACGPSGMPEDEERVGIAEDALARIQCPSLTSRPNTLMLICPIRIDRDIQGWEHWVAWESQTPNPVLDAWFAPGIAFKAQRAIKLPNGQYQPQGASVALMDVYRIEEVDRWQHLVVRKLYDSRGSEVGSMVADTSHAAMDYPGGGFNYVDLY